MINKKIFVGLALLFSVSAFAQDEGQINPNSILNIPKYEQLYKVKVWRTLDLNEKQNKGFFAKGNEITMLIINSVKSGELVDIYKSDSLDETRKLDKAAFQNLLIAQAAAPLPTWEPKKNFFQGEQVTYNGLNYEALVDNTGKNPTTSLNEWQKTPAGMAISFLPGDITRMKIVEDIIFDKRRSRLYYDMQAIGFEALDPIVNSYRKLGYFKYKDLEKLFKNHPKEAVWFNRYNSAENRNYADAFLLRLFHGTIEKIENPDDMGIFDLYRANGRPYSEGVWATEWEEMKLMEKEHNLWEY